MKPIVKQKQPTLQKIIDDAQAGGGSGGTSDYTELENKPQINSVTLTGNKSLSDLGITEIPNYNKADIGDVLKVYSIGLEKGIEWGKADMKCDVNQLTSSGTYTIGRMKTGAYLYVIWSGNSTTYAPVDLTGVDNITVSLVIFYDRSYNRCTYTPIYDETHGDYTINVDSTTHIGTITFSPQGNNRTLTILSIPLYTWGDF